MIYLKTDNKDELHYCMHKIFAEQSQLRDERNRNIVEYSKIYWLYQRTENKLDEVFSLFFDMTQKSELK